MKKAVVVSGFWGQNIGNAFFNLGGKFTLERSGFDVSFAQDQPAYWTFRDEAKGNFERSFDLLGALEVDLVVLQGPLLTRNFGNIWESTLRRLHSRGIDWAILSGAFRSYSDQELAVASDVIRRYPPAFVSTRDEESADILSGVFPEVRSGVCSAFFVSRLFEPPRIAGDPLVCLTFDHFGEPEIVAGGDDLVLDGHGYALNFHRLTDKLASKSKAHAYLGRAIDRRVLPGSVGRHTIVRPEHRTNPHLPWKIYGRPNGLASDEPWTYLAAYAAADVTISDRVHACVAALAYGRKAMLHNPTTRRHALFAAMGAGGIDHRPVRIDTTRIDKELADVVEFLADFS